MKIWNFGSMCHILLISRGLQGHSLLKSLGITETRLTQEERQALFFLKATILQQLYLK